jgi:Ca2+-binding RTX toxin-like protein
MRRVVLVLAAMALAMLPASGVAWAVTKIGTNGPETLRGTTKSDNLVGRGGNDVLFSYAGNDHLLGGLGKDILFGGNPERGESSRGNKSLVGGSGNDAVVGGKGPDNLVGGEGNDWVHDGFEPKRRAAAQDILFGGSGDDVLDAIHNPAAKDLVICGGGFDLVIVNTTDVVAPDCEKVFIGISSFDAWVEAIPEHFFDELHPGFEI